MRAMTTLAVLCLLSTAAYAQAFGTTEGMKLQEFETVVLAPDIDGEERYKVTPPEPNAAFDIYYVRLGADGGLCQIEGEMSQGLSETDASLVKSRIEGFLAQRYAEKPLRIGDMVTGFEESGTLPRVSIRNVIGSVSITYEYLQTDACQMQQFDRSGL